MGSLIKTLGVSAICQRWSIGWGTDGSLCVCVYTCTIVCFSLFKQSLLLCGHVTLPVGQKRCCRTWRINTSTQSDMAWMVVFSKLIKPRHHIPWEVFDILLFVTWHNQKTCMQKNILKMFMFTRSFFLLPVCFWFPQMSVLLERSMNLVG